MWIAASAVLVIAGILVGAVARRITREVDHLTAEVVALRRTRIEMASLRQRDLPAPAVRWLSDGGSPR
jgi:hypothetical protein